MSSCPPSAHGPIDSVRGNPAVLPDLAADQDLPAVLEDEEYDDYWMMLEAGPLGDSDPVRTLPRCAAALADPDTRELAQDHLSRSPPVVPEAVRQGA